MDCWRAPSGDTGPSGSVPAAAAAPGSPGADGALILRNPQSAAILPIAVPTGLLTRAIHDAELLMVNGRADMAYQDLNWLHFVIASTRERYPSGFADALQAKVLALTQLVAHGLDVFGRNFNYVPLTSFDELAVLARDQLTYLKNVEERHARLEDAAASQADRINALREAGDQLTAFLSDKGAEVAAKSARAGELQDEVRTLFFELEAVHRQLMAAESSFKKAVAERNNCASFGNVLKFAALVATVVATAGAAATAAAAAATALEGLRTMESAAAANMTWKAVKTDLNTISTHVKPAGKTAAEFADSFGKAQKAYKDLFPDREPMPDVLDQSEDAVRLVAAKEDFDKAIKPYLGMSAARRYQAIMHKYIALAETRNNKILEHDRTVVEIVQINARTVIERQTVARLAATTAANFDTRLTENLAFLETSLATLKWGAIRHLVSMEKSLEYMVGTPGASQYSDVSVGTLSATATQLLQRFGQVLEGFGQEAQFGRHFSVRLSDILSRGEIDRFARGDPVAFALNEIDDQLFANFYAVQTARIGLVGADGKPIPGEMSVTFEHCGRSVVRQRDRSSRVFAHVPVTASYVQGLFNNVSARGDLLSPPNNGHARYVGVSPYGPWRMRLNSASTQVRSALRKGFLTLDVGFRTLPIGPAA